LFTDNRTEHNQRVKRCVERDVINDLIQ
jgi:hypothetical protein